VNQTVQKFVLLWILMGLPIRALAQAPAAAPAPPPPPAREGTAEFAFVGTSGNASTQTIGLNGTFIARPGLWVVTNEASYVRNEAESQLTAQSFAYLFRAARTISPRLSAFGEYSYFRDAFAGIGHRNSLVGGISYKVVNLPRHQFFTDAGLGYINEKRLAGHDESSATWSLGAGYRWKFSDTAEFTEDLRTTGLFADSVDWRVLQAAAVAARLTKTFSLKVSNTIRYSHEPVPGFKTTDTTTSVALVAKF
jgi:putative salt-induced outer membrane protein